MEMIDQTFVEDIDMNNAIQFLINEFHYTVEEARLIVHNHEAALAVLKSRGTLG
jgi:hypothetical protein